MPEAPVQGDRMDWVAVALEEYKTLRTESLAAIEQMQRTLQIGLVAIGVITGFGVDASDSPPGVQVAIAIAPPAFAALVLVMWLDELRRAVFAGAHIAGLEHQIAGRYEGEDPPLKWETGIQAAYDPDQGYRYVRHWATAAALFAATGPVAVSGLLRLGQDGEWTLFKVAAVGLAIVLLAAGFYQRGVHRAMKKKHRETRGQLGLGPEVKQT
jgi:hypothetical protein